MPRATRRLPCASAPPCSLPETSLDAACDVSGSLSVSLNAIRRTSAASVGPGTRILTVGASMINHSADDGAVPVIDLARAPSALPDLARSRTANYLWQLASLVFVGNRLQISSRLRVAVLRRFGAKIGKGVVFRPRTRVKSPWHLEIGDNCWIGDGVWIDNQDHVSVGHDVVLSQDTYLTTGAHAFRRDMALISRPIVIEPGVWISSRCVVLGGAQVGRSAVVSPLTVIKGRIPANAIVAMPEATVVGHRFPESTEP